MTDIAPQPAPRSRTLSRLQALVLALVLIVCGMAIARADRPENPVPAEAGNH